jgi:hypothetical protein
MLVAQEHLGKVIQVAQGYTLLEYPKLVAVAAVLLLLVAMPLEILEATVAQGYQVHFQALLSPMLAVVVRQQVDLVVQVAVVRVALPVLAVRLELQIQAVVAAVVIPHKMVLQAAQALLSFVTRELFQEPQAAQSQLVADTSFIHSHLAVHLQLN